MSDDRYDREAADRAAERLGAAVTRKLELWEQLKAAVSKLQTVLDDPDAASEQLDVIHRLTGEGASVDEECRAAGKLFVEATKGAFRHVRPKGGIQ